MRSTLAITALLLSACGGAPAPAPASGGSSTATATPADGQLVVLHRDLHVGDTFGISMDGATRTRTVVTVDGQQVSGEEKQFAVHMVADVVIQEVNARGKATRSQYTMTELTTGGDDPQEILPAGSVVIVTAVEGAGRGTITLVGGELTEEQNEQLELVMTTHLFEHGDDDVFGSTEPHEIGDSWPVNAEIAAHDLSQIPNMTFAAANISGSTTLAGVEDVDGVPCQIVQAAIVARDFELGDLPPGSVVQRGGIEMRMAAALPVEGSGQRLRSEEAMAMQMVVQIPTEDGRTALMTVDNRNMKSTVIRP